MNTMTMLPTRLIAELSGASYRQLDNWERTGVLCASVRATGCGSRREYTADQAVEARIVFLLQRLGAPLETVVARALPHMTAADGLVAIDSDGNVRPLYDLPSGVEAAWVIDVVAARRHVERRLASVLTDV